MITLYKRGRVWWARGSVSRKPIRPRSLDTGNKDVAARRAAALELGMGEGKPAPVPWEKFEREFLSWIRLSVKPGTCVKYEFTVRRLSKFLRAEGIASLQGVTPEVISGYIQRRQQDIHPTRKKQIGWEGMKSDLRVLRRLFNRAIESGYLTRNPVLVKNLNSRTGNTRPFTQAEIDSMLADPRVRSRPRLRAQILMLLYTGLRIGDVLSFPVKALDLEAGYIQIVTQKRDKPVVLGIHPDLRRAIEEYLPTRSGESRSPLLFTSPTGKVVKSLSWSLRQVWDRCGIEGAHPHRFRDTFAVRLLQKGASLYDVAKLMGITVAMAERSYTPYVRELQERGKRLIMELDFIKPSVQLAHSMDADTP